MAQRLTVVQMLPALESGGVEKGTLEVGKYLVDHGHRSFVISDGGRLVAQLEREGSEHVSQNWREALELYEETIARRAEWSPRDVSSIVPLAQAALRAGKPREAGLLIRGFDKKHPNHEDIPRAYLVGAQIMAEYANKPDDAKRILEHLVKRYASDPVAAEAARYLEVMRRMAQ